ncbi:MAG: transposase [Verrucomicrobia bacterium]|jgi:putative transposase|nr:transposase [Verrucomicrobiota bacterium]
MSRPPRIGFAGALHHAMARGDRGEEIFRDDQDRLKFLGYLAEGMERYKVKLHCYVLMENHFHLVATTTQANLSKWMHQLKTAYSVYFNRRHKLVGHLFQGRFKSTVIEAEKYLLEVSRYLHLNPVRGLKLGQATAVERRERLRDYRWSSYRSYAGLEKMKSFLDSEAVEEVFESFSGGRWKAWKYRRWVEEALVTGIEDPFQAVKGQQVLGEEKFYRKLRDHWNQRVDRPKNYGQKRNWSASLGAEEILKRVSRHFKSNAERLKERARRGGLARRCAITLCWDYAGLSHSEIATLFRLPSSNSVAQTIRRTKATDARTLALLKTKLGHR